MLTPSGRTDGPDTVRRLNVPAPLQVEVDTHGSPHRVYHRKRWYTVAQIRERYRTVDRWWTEAPISREYLDVLLDNGQPLSIFHDRIERRWYAQRYG